MADRFASLVSLFGDDVSVRWLITLLHFLWQGAVVGGVVAIAGRVLRGASARARYALYSATLLSLPACVALTFCVVDAPAGLPASSQVESPADVPALSSALPSQATAMTPEVPVETAATTDAPVPSPRAVSDAATMTAVADDDPKSLSHSSLPMLSRAAPWISVAYIVGVACFLLRLSTALWGGHRFRTRMACVTDAKLLGLIADQANCVKLKCVPVVAYCERVAVPTVLGVLRPIVLLPASLMTGLSPDEFAAIIRHELAHIRRYDLWMNLLQRVIESLLFFHPVVWFISRRLNAEREVCCDDLVVSSGYEPMHYAGALLRMAELCAISRQSGALALNASGDKTPLLEKRIERLMNWGGTPRLQLTRAGMAALLMTLAALIVVPGIAHTWAQAQVQDTAPPAKGLDVASPSVQTQPGQEQEPQGATDLASTERRLRSVHEKVGPAIVRIAHVNDEDHEWHFGSGVIVTADGHVVTTRNPTSTIPKGTRLAFHLADGRRVTGIELGWSGECRIGLARITEKGPWPHVKLGNTTEVKAGQLCVEMGHPLKPGDGFEDRPSSSLGRVTSSAFPVWFTSSCALERPGSGVFDLEGQLLGVTTGSHSHPYSGPFEEDSLHTSVELIKTHWDALAAGRNLDRVRLLSSEEDTGGPPGTRGTESEGTESEGTKDEDRFAAAIQRARPASVRVREGVKGGWSGTIVTADGYVITCGHHGRFPGAKVTISLPDGREAAGVVLGTNLVSDVGLMKITDKGPWPHVEMGNSAMMSPGDPCLVMGYPGESADKLPLVRRAQIAAPKGDSLSCVLYTSQCRLYPGDSGGGVFDLDGHLVALNDRMADTRPPLTRHRRVELLSKQWDFLAAGKAVSATPSQSLGEVPAAFGRVANPGHIVVEVLGDTKLRALGTIVGSEGRILTKASELQGMLSCRFADGQVLKASVEKVSREHDLAVLKVDATNLAAADFSSLETVSPGTMIAALTPKNSPLLGMVSRPVRSIAPERGWFGVWVFDDDSSVRVADDSTARELDVPLRTDDVITQVEGHPTPDWKTYLEVMEPTAGAAIVYGGDPIRVSVKRGEETLEFSFPLPSRPYNHNELSRSKRCSAFPSVFDTHVRLTPKMCGGPVVDKTGHLVGVAIACRNLGWIYVIPASVVREVIAD